MSHRMSRYVSPGEVEVETHVGARNSVNIMPSIWTCGLKISENLPSSHFYLNPEGCQVVRVRESDLSYAPAVQIRDVCRVDEGRGEACKMSTNFITIT